jgi:hypothetical protein
MAFVSLDSPSCEVPCLILHLVVYRDVTRQAKGLYRLKHVGALKSGLAYLSRCNSGWFCHINEGRDAWSVIDSRRKVREEVETEGTDCSGRFPAFSARFSSYKYPEGFKPIGITKYDGKQAPQEWLRCYSTALRLQGARTSPRLSTSRWPWTLRRSHGWRASPTTPSTPGSSLRRSSSTTSRERLLAQVLVMILLSVNRNVTSSCSPTRVASSTSVPPSRTSRRTTSSTASTTASLT